MITVMYSLKPIFKIKVHNPDFKVIILVVLGFSVENLEVSKMV